MTARELAAMLLEHPDANVRINKLEIYGDDLPNMDEKEVLLPKDEVYYNGTEYILGAGAII